MGVLTKVRNGIVKAAEKGADAVSAMSQDVYKRQMKE